jgi:hypothetical protein
MWLLNHVYLAAQLVVVPGALIWLYREAPALYRRLRNTIVATWMIAVPIYAMFPVAPPRLAAIGMLNSRLSTAFYNTLAAVPSLHAGFAPAVAVALAFALRRRWAKALALAWAPLVALAVVATGITTSLTLLPVLPSPRLDTR